VEWWQNPAIIAPVSGIAAVLAKDFFANLITGKKNQNDWTLALQQSWQDEERKLREDLWKRIESLKVSEEKAILKAESQGEIIQNLHILVNQLREEKSKAVSDRVEMEDECERWKIMAENALHAQKTAEGGMVIAQKTTETVVGTLKEVVNANHREVTNDETG
jgi:hypothetical protein